MHMLRSLSIRSLQHAPVRPGYQSRTYPSNLPLPPLPPLPPFACEQSRHTPSFGLFLPVHRLLLCTMLLFVPLCAAAASATPAANVEWLSWLDNLGHDTYSYPLWISEQINDCRCARIATGGGACTWKSGSAVDWRGATELTFCTCKSWLLSHMPEFDLHYLPGSVSVNGTSMLDDTIAFALMADRAAPWSASIPMDAKLAYILPYAGYHESRQNWRPLFFAKFFQLVANATSVEEVVARLVAPNVFTQWAEHYWPSSPRQPEPAAGAYHIEWSSSTAPPVVSPFEFVAYGYGSCSAWATFITYTFRAVGLPARQSGTPCWNSVYGRDFRGLAVHNPNVTLCWHGGSTDLGHGGGFLNNHNWVEVYLPASGSSAARWAHINVPPDSKTPDTGLCGAFEPSQGCGFDASRPAGHECDGVTGGPGAAMRDHQIFSVTWSKAGEHEVGFEGGPVVDVADLTLSDGQSVSPLVWSPKLLSPLGEPLASTGLRMVDRTEHYACKPTKTRSSE